MMNHVLPSLSGSSQANRLEKAERCVAREYRLPQVACLLRLASENLGISNNPKTGLIESESRCS